MKMLNDVVLRIFLNLFFKVTIYLQSLIHSFLFISPSPKSIQGSAIASIFPLPILNYPKFHCTYFKTPCTTSIINYSLDNVKKYWSNTKSTNIGVVIKSKLIYCTNSKLLNTASTQFQYNINSVKFQNFNVNRVSTQYQLLTIVWNSVDIFLLMFFFSFDHIPIRYM